MSSTVITAENLSKAYRIGLKQETPDTLVGMLSSWAKSPWRNFRRLRRLNTFNEKHHADGSSSNGNGKPHTKRQSVGDIVWALNDVNFEVRQGEVLGVIGGNGAGKSTLLKILSRITEPTSGRARICGRVSSLLEVGTGFHPELTGRENVYMNGTMLGMTKREIDSKFDEIVEFSGVAKYLDTPVKRYSSGMSLRLAFSVAAHLEPEILIIDEVLAVGDAEFQQRCLGKMEDVSSSGRTVLFVSHNMAAIQSLCSRAILLRDGGMVFDGTPEDTVAEYLAAGETVSRQDLRQARENRGGDGRLRFVNWSVVDDVLGEGDTVRTGCPCRFRLQFEAAGAADRLDRVAVTITIKDSLGQPLLSCSTKFVGTVFSRVDASGTFECRLNSVPLIPGSYVVHLWCSVEGQAADVIRRAGQLTVAPTDYFGTGVLPRKWQGHTIVNHTWCLT